MEKFNLKHAYLGKPVCTRDGHKARIICFDYKEALGKYPIIALISVTDRNGLEYEAIVPYAIDGKYRVGSVEDGRDLMMVTSDKDICVRD